MMLSWSSRQMVYSYCCCIYVITRPSLMFNLDFQHVGCSHGFLYGSSWYLWMMLVESFQLLIIHRGMVQLLQILSCHFSCLLSGFHLDLHIRYIFKSCSFYSYAQFYLGYMYNICSDPRRLSWFKLNTYNHHWRNAFHYLSPHCTLWAPTNLKIPEFTPRKEHKFMY